jgi:hypothetical protein
MALLGITDASGMDGARVVFGPASAGGDTLIGGAGVHLFVLNGGGSPITVTLVTPEVREGSLPVADRDIPVAAGEWQEIPVPSRYNAASGLASVLYTSVTSVTVAAVRGSLRTAGITIGAILPAPPGPTTVTANALLAATAAVSLTAPSSIIGAASLSATASLTGLGPGVQSGAALSASAAPSGGGASILFSGAGAAASAAISAAPASATDPYLATYATSY